MRVRHVPAASIGIDDRWCHRDCFSDIPTTNGASANTVEVQHITPANGDITENVLKLVAFLIASAAATVALWTAN